ncbi:MAG: TrmH family RNA methyltransferase [Candidatus Thiodiazotropha weberae]|uniref:tRNA (Guanine-N2)-dimethyltransferase n=1 Tax=Candidatus Thiodiazotropha endoloripes TaxID=1818881 RepID=A0A1E2UUZ7_9GAMM|nr:TrmH family RNA methyltransferase [Candidatus Thiodiazotropha endoloripes]MCG7898903.1 TrmH family RNA methyltransferase [Candidatus Thiodiazotropha weberae]MCG7914951.1 TrmH family RNA methyltransferase [Candidatus Thiodiazotropha weberae]ODB83852.1 tRNA (guanine-N2)-dimethyltransferase [Candidatus Thiodiazotropha endoloripes]ODB93936.1 tRNA (guanine-N2)-dimethyltransferase [Candidatus Thiodiazotropha endoloripes]ODB98422.1 tRNA (guanine-N2)-dimethyltransferase [Candidatus Thiodiazotropha 
MLRQRKSKREKREARDQALLRYTKQRQRNVLAKPGVNDFILVLDHMKAGFNVAKIFRSAEAFGAAEVHLIDIGPFDPSPGKGAFKKVPAKFYDSFEQSYQELVKRDYKIVALSGDCEHLSTESVLDSKTAFVLGHEEWGHSFEMADYPDIRCLAIPQFGQVESLNVAVAASIMMYEYIRQHPSR